MRFRAAREREAGERERLTGRSVSDVEARVDHHDQREAVAAYRTATELDPSNQQAKYGLGKALKDSGQAAEGDALMAAALSSDPRANEGYDTPLLEVRVSD